MNYRSLLFVPADQQRKLDRAAESDADALILDLEDAVAANRKAEAREMARAHLEVAISGPARLVRVNALSTGLTKDDVAATVSAHPAGYVLPKCEGVEDIEALAAMIRHHGGDELPIMAIATESVRAVRNLMRADWAHPCLGALSWGGEDLSAAIGAMRNRDSQGSYLSPFTLARDLTLLAAIDAGVMAIDAVHTDLHDGSDLQAESELARDLGFTGKMAIHPAQIATINAAFAPSAEQIDWAVKVVEAFSVTSIGVNRLRDEMLDAPHYRRARRILASVARATGEPNS